MNNENETLSEPGKRIRKSAHVEAGLWLINYMN